MPQRCEDAGCYQNVIAATKPIFTSALMINHFR
jgi:hypothetical protein